MDKKDIRIGDTVEVSFKAKVTGKNGDYANLDVGKTVVALEYYLISNVIARAETDTQKTARLEARVAELEKENDVLAQGQLSRYRQRFPDMEAAWTEQEKPWYPKQLEGFGPWIEGPPPLDLPLGSFQPLGPHERESKSFYTISGNMGAGAYQHCVAHCIKKD